MVKGREGILHEVGGVNPELDFIRLSCIENKGEWREYAFGCRSLEFKREVQDGNITFGVFKT
jgi:hypothetical protein